jgi:hypothetical protein
MANVAYVAAGVRTVSATSSQLTTGVLGEAVTRGQPLYQSSTDSKYYLADGNTVDPAPAAFAAYALDTGVENDTISIQTGGIIYLGVDVTQGMVYFVSDEVGETESGDTALASGLNPTVIGYGNADNELVIDVTVVGLAIYP